MPCQEMWFSFNLVLLAPRLRSAHSDQTTTTHTNSKVDFDVKVVRIEELLGYMADSRVISEQTTKAAKNRRTAPARLCVVPAANRKSETTASK